MEGQMLEPSPCGSCGSRSQGGAPGQETVCGLHQNASWRRTSLPPAQGEMLGTALQAASARGRDQIVQRLLKHGANVNTQRGDYGIALQAASAEGHDQIVQQQLEHGADVNTQ